MIKLMNITKKFDEQVVLKNISMNFEKEKIHGIIGRNGSGKTVIFKCICGLTYPDSGEIYINDLSITRKSRSPYRIGIIIESPGFLPNYSGLRNLTMLASINKLITKEEIIETMLMVGLDPYNKKHVGKYSMGMRQRLGIAQAIMENPDILILDEPMNGLDHSGVNDVRSLLLDMKKRGKTILISSHNREDIDTLCDTVHEMDDGIVTRKR